MRTCCWLILAACTLAGLSARADTVKLKDGTTLEGEIVAEDDSTLSILVEFAGGTITQTRHVNKADIAGVIRWTPEEKAERAERRDYENLQKYQLSRSTSFSAEYYDQVINNGFHKFLADHPDSPYTTNIIERAGQWIAERDKVAGGQAKYHGRWMPAVEVVRERGGELLQQGRALLARGSPDLAIQQLRPVLLLSEQTNLVTQAKALLTSAYQQLYIPLDHLQQQLPGEISAAQQRMDQARQTLGQAEASLKQTIGGGQTFGAPQDANGSSYQAMGGNSQQVFQNQAAVSRAQSDFISAQSHLAELQREFTAVKQRITTLQAQASALGIPITGGATPTVAAVPATSAPASPISADAPPVLAGIIAFIKDKWPVLVVAGLVAIYLLSRLTKG